MMSRFEELRKKALNKPEIHEYVNSLQVIMGDLVLAKRLHSGWTQAQLATRAGVQQKTISRIEAGDPGVKIGTLDKVMQSLGLDCSFLETTSAKS
jgi:transcriptional regulator with XRE-family HTH domain